ncbi:leucine-rich repeat domain-containing protein, partial [archaeon]
MLTDTKRVLNFEELVKQHGYVKARQLLKRSNLQNHQLDVQKKEDEIHEALKPQRIKNSIIMSATAGKPPEDSMLEKILQANRGIAALELASRSGEDLLTMSKSILQSASAQDILTLVKKHEERLPKQSFIHQDDMRYVLQSKEQKLLIPNKGYDTLPAGLGETLLMQTGFLQELHCARNNLQSLLSPQMPQFSTYHIRYIRTLDLSYNQLSRLPDNFGNLQLLEKIDLSYNKLSRVPPSFLTLQYLHTLILEGNNFDTLPTELGTLDSITHLDLSRNLFQTFPFAAMKLTGIKKLHLGNNLITHLATLPPLLTPADLWIDHIDRRTGQIVQMNIITREKVSHIELYNGVGIQQATDLHTYQIPLTRSYRRRKLWLSACGIHEWEPVIDGITGGVYYRNNVSGEGSATMPLSLDTLGTMHTLTELTISRNSISYLPKSFTLLTGLKKLVFTQNRLRELPEDFGGEVGG